MDLGFVALPARAIPLLTWVVAIWLVDRLVVRDAPRFGLERPAVANLIPGVALVALAGARGMAVLPHWRVMLAHPLDLLRVTDGLSLAGGIVGGLGGLAVLCWRWSLPFSPVADLLGSALPYGVAAYSAGCLGRNDCYGRAAPAPFGVVFPGLATPRYPVELYAAGGALLVAAGLELVRRRPRPGGELALVSLGALSTMWLALDRFRLTTDGDWAHPDRLALAVTAALAAAAVVAAAAVGRASVVRGAWNGSRTGDR